LGQLTATVNHELRNPLAAIRTALYMLHKTVDVENHDQVATSLGLMDRNVDRCDHIIDQMLDFTRVQSLDREDVLLDEWLLAVMDEQSIPEAVTVECKMNLPGRIVSLNPDGFRRAVINLVDNACKAMTENADQCDATRTARLKISTQAIDDRIEVEVTDNGPGIPEDVLPHIFEPLYSTRGFGVGLGLPTVRQLLQQHGGDVKVETVVGKGTRMLLWFPINKATEAVE
jgi:signal transduction histidine kinase